MRKRENKNYSFVPSLLDAQLKIPKKLQKNLKNQKNTIMGFVQFLPDALWKI